MSRSDSEINKTLCNTRRVFRLCHFIWLRKWARKHQSGISEDFPFMPSLMTNSTGFITVIGNFCLELGFYELSVSVCTEWSELWAVISDTLPPRIFHPFGSSARFPLFPKPRLPLLDLCQHSQLPCAPGTRLRSLVPPLVSVYKTSLLLQEKTSHGAVAFCIDLSLKELYL